MSDISPEELERLYDEIDADIKKNGLPTDEELMAEIEKANAGPKTNLPYLNKPLDGG